MASGGRDEDFPTRLQLDERRMEPDCNHDEMVSLLIGWGAERADRAVELLPDDRRMELLSGKRCAAGLPLGDWIRRTAVARSLAYLAEHGLIAASAVPPKTHVVDPPAEPSRNWEELAKCAASLVASSDARADASDTGAAPTPA